MIARKRASYTNSIRLHCRALRGELPGFSSRPAARACSSRGLLRGVLADFLGDLHRAEMRTAHGAEMRRLRTFLRRVSSWKERAISGSSARLNWSSHRNSKRALLSALSRLLRGRMILGEVGGVGGNLVGDDAGRTSSRSGSRDAPSA